MQSRRSGLGPRARADAVDALLALWRSRPASGGDAVDGPGAQLLSVAPLVLDGHPDLFPGLAETPEVRALLGPAGISHLRAELQREFGVDIPPLRIRPNDALPPGHLRLLHDEVPVVQRAVDPSAYAAVVLGELGALARHRLDQFVGAQEATNLLAGWRAGSAERAALCERAVPGPPGVRRLVLVLKDLLREQVPVHDIGAIVDALADAGDAADAAELVRRRIDASGLGLSASTRLIRLSGRDERRLRGVAGPRDGAAPTGDDPLVDHVIASLGTAAPTRGSAAVVVADPALRRSVRSHLQARLPDLPVVTLADLLRFGLTAPSPLEPIDGQHQPAS